MEIHFGRIGILGVGLIGGSLGLAIKRASRYPRVVGTGRNEEHLRRAQAMGAIDEFDLDMARALRDCDLVILATPVEHIAAVLQTLGPHLARGSVVTDAGSTKRQICHTAWERLPASVEFIGGHPVAGREVAGIENSLPELFRGAPYILCPRDAASENLLRLRSLAQIVGAYPVVMTPEEHDRTMGRVSHLPQLLSTALANVTEQEDARIAGTGLRDMLRLAGSSYSVWMGILESNADNIDAVLQQFMEHLEKVRGMLRDGRLRGEFDRAQERYRKVLSLK